MAGSGEGVWGVHVGVESLPHGHEFGVGAGFGLPGTGEAGIGVWCGLAAGIYGLDANAGGVAGGCFIGEVGDEEGDGCGPAGVALDGWEELADGVEGDASGAFFNEAKHGCINS